MALLIVAPVYNEEPLIRKFLARIMAISAAARICALVLVDDGSNDGTREAIRSFVRSSDPPIPIRLVCLSRNFGHQNAVLAGLVEAHRWAPELGAEFIGLIDADLQDRPEHFATLMDAAIDADVVYAKRASRAEGIIFRSLAAAFHRLLARNAKHPIPEQAGTFSVMRRRVVGEILESADQAPYFPGLRAWVGHRQKGVNLDRDARPSGESKVGARGLFRLAIQALFSYSDLPFKLMTVTAFTVLILSLMAAMTMVVLKLSGQVEVQGTALIVVAIFFSLGVQSVYLLIIAYIISRALSEITRRKPYVVTEVEDIF